MQIDRIKITNFKSIPELDLPFKDMSGMWEISGVVGAGKTTIGEAIIFALFGSIRGKTNDSLISWGKKHTLVEAWVYTKNRHLYIRREINSYGQSPLTATVDGEEVLGSDKRSIQNILETEWYDINRQTLELLCVISFNNFKSLSTLNTADSREFLDSTVSFDKLDEYEEYCKSQIRELNEKISAYQKDLQEYAGGLKVLNETNPDKPKYENVVFVDDKLKHERDILEGMEKEYNTKKKELNTIAKTRSDQHKSLVATLKHLQSNYKQLQSGICPLCGGAVTPEHRQELESEIQSKQKMAEHYKAHAAATTQAVLDWDMKNSEKIKKQNEVIFDLIFEKKKTLLYEEHLEKISTKRKSYEKDMTVLNAAIEELKVQVGDWQEMLDFMRDKVRPAIIGSILPNINNYIQYYMDRTHQNYVVFFDENFKCMMKNPFGETIPVSSLSTGQKKIIDMVIILAFIKTFITQIDFNVYFMDELMGNIDADLRDEMCALLKDTLDEGDVMFLICHSPINQEWLDGIIKVSRSAGISDYQILPINK